MTLNVRAFGLAAGIVAAVLFVICAVAVALAPEATTAVAGFLLHVDLGGFSRSVTPGNFIGGLIGWSVGTAITFAAAAALYNRLSGARG